MKVNNGHQESHEGVLSDYCDGKNFKNHALFKEEPTSLQIILYFDELELGSHRKKHKFINLFSCSYIIVTPMIILNILITFICCQGLTFLSHV